MSGPAFAEHCGLKYPTFAGWAAKRKKEEGSGGHATSKRQFVLAEFGTAPDPGASGLHIELPGGASARLADTGQVELLVTLIRALAR